MSSEILAQGLVVAYVIMCRDGNLGSPTGTTAVHFKYLQTVLSRQT